MKNEIKEEKAKSESMEKLKNGEWLTWWVRYASNQRGFVFVRYRGEEYFRELYQKYETQWVWDNSTMLRGDVVDAVTVMRELYEHKQRINALRVARLFFNDYKSSDEDIEERMLRVIK